MPIFTIIGGVNGCGKSSFTGVLKQTRNDLGIIIDVDKIAKENDNNNLFAGKLAISKINELINKGVNLTQETTLSGFRNEKIIRFAKENQYQIRLYYIGLNSAQESIERIKNRVKRGGHSIPEEDVIRRFNSRFDSLFKILPYCDEAYFFDNDNGFTEVGEYKNGEIILTKETDWLKALIHEYSNQIYSINEQEIEL